MLLDSAYYYLYCYPCPCHAYALRVYVYAAERRDRSSRGSDYGYEPLSHRRLTPALLIT